MKILAIETSCDETAAAVIENGTKVLSNIVASSQEMHEQTGGIIPEAAARAQIRSIIPVINKAIEDSNQNIDQIDALAVTYGPGLIGSLLVGVETAKTLAVVWNKPLIPVNHLVAHLYACFIDHKLDPPQFPAIGMVVSGGHTDLVLIKGHGDITLLGATRDDAAGEAFDKTARLLELPYPGGPAISKLAEEYRTGHPELDSDSIPDLDLFPRPMIDSDDYDFSFSGLKTAVLNYLKANANVDKNYIAANIEEAITDTLIAKSTKAIEKYKSKSFLLSGGVAANKRLREKFEKYFKAKGIKFYVPAPQYCTDNAAAIGAAAYYLNKKADIETINANPAASIV